MPAAITRLALRHPLVVLAALAAIVTWQWRTVSGLRVDLGDAMVRLSAAEQANATNIAALSVLRMERDRIVARLGEVSAADAQRSAVAATIKESSRHASVPKDTCQSVSPGLRTALDGLRRARLQTHSDTRGAHGAASVPADLQP